MGKWTRGERGRSVSPCIHTGSVRQYSAMRKNDNRVKIGFFVSAIDYPKNSILTSLVTNDRVARQTWRSLKMRLVDKCRPTVFNVVASV